MESCVDLFEAGDHVGGGLGQLRVLVAPQVRLQRRLEGAEREFFIDNLLIRIHFIIVMIRWTGLAPWEFEFPFPGSLTYTFLGGCMVWCVEFQVSGFRFQVSGFRCTVQSSAFGFRVSSFGRRGQGCTFMVQG